MKHYLARFSTNWADEMDIDGFKVLTEAEKDDLVKTIKKVFKKEREVYWGTNEYSTYHNPKHLLNEIKFEELSSKEAKTFKAHFPYGFGHRYLLDADSIREIAEEDDEL